MSRRAVYYIIAVSMLLGSCGGEKEKKAVSDLPTRTVNVPRVNADSAYFFVEKQVAFGPRVPNSAAHRLAGDYFINRFQQYGATVSVQEFEATTFDNRRLKLRNIIASFNPNKQKRILLAAHWDTRPFADKDSIKRDAPFDGANDGASGVGVLLEIARQLGKYPPLAGVDIILFDGEDWGEKDGGKRSEPPPGDFQVWWCLGSQYWAHHKHKANYSAYYGILLDMVGAKGSRFFREGGSLENAPRIVDKVWNTAERLGYSNYFVKQNAGDITDDHRFVNEIAKIPMIDIVHYQPGIGYFGEYHHTRQDNMSIISRETLGVVGDVLMNVIYFEE
jgi:glutaminyl-peptide cyclotransferase